MYRYISHQSQQNIYIYLYCRGLQRGDGSRTRYPKTFVLISKPKPFEKSDPSRVLFIYLFELYCRLLVPLLSTWALIPLCNTPNPRDSRRYWARISQWIPARAWQQFHGILQQRTNKLRQNQKIKHKLVQSLYKCWVQQNKAYTKPNHA